MYSVPTSTPRLGRLMRNRAVLNHWRLHIAARLHGNVQMVVAIHKTAHMENHPHDAGTDLPNLIFYDISGISRPPVKNATDNSTDPDIRRTD